MTVKITAADLARHATSSDLWVAIDGVVYDLTEFAPLHPGGLDVLLRYAGCNATAAYSQVHSPSLVQTTLHPSKQMGRLSPALPSLQNTTPWGVADCLAINANAPTPARPPLSSLISTYDFLSAAQEALPPKTLAFVTSAATDLLTHRANSAAYAAITLRPRVLRGVEGPISLTSALFSTRINTPLFCAPTSLGKTVHPEGERELARGCRGVGVAQVVSTSASFTLSEVFAAARESQGDHHPIFFQLYVDKNRANSERLLREAVALGIKGVFVTIDAPVAGKREADERLQSQESVVTPMSGVRAVNDAAGGGLGRIMGAYVDASLCWDDLAWVRSCLPTGMPIVLKGIQTAADAVRAMSTGVVQGIVISNHGGRSLDTSPPTILVLLELHRCCPEVFDGLEVLIDGGVMRGTDVFKALCLGAKGVGIGRGVLYGVQYGAEGVMRYFDSMFLGLLCRILSSSLCFAILSVFIILYHPHISALPCPALPSN